MNSKVLSFVNKMEGWKTAIKSLHWDAKNMSQHKLCDDIAERLADFQDQVSEVEQSISGKLPLNKLKGTDYNIGNLKSFVEDMISDTTSFLKDMESEGDKYIGMRSDCESFLSDMQRNLYLVDFTMKEELKRDIIAKINESKPKNLANVDTIEKFIGRRPKTIKARINQIYRIVKKYGVDSRIYTDDHWQAISDYYDAITSLGCEVEMKPCGHIENADSIGSDGGYCDYDQTDNMPRSKQYAINIIFEDGMKVSGYIKCMAAGTMEDPFSRYDTCMVLWPKSNRTIGEGKLYEFYNPDGNLDDPVSPYSHTVPDFGGNKDLENEYSWNRFDNKGIAPGSGSFKYNVNKSGIPYETDKIMRNRNRLNYFSDNDNKNGREFMNSWVNGKRELPMENKKRMLSLTEGEIKQLVKEAVTRIIESFSPVSDAEKNFENQLSWGYDRLNRQKEMNDFDKENELINKGVKYKRQTDDLHKNNPELWRHTVGLTNEDINIKPENKGKFTATKKATGKSTEELTHSKNPLTRKRAIFAQNAKKWNKK